MASWSIEKRVYFMGDIRVCIDSILDSLSRRIFIPEEALFNARIIMSELCINGLQHGRCPVMITVSLCGDHSLHILVSDSGRGFDAAKLPKHTDAAKESGRGLQLVNGLSEGLAFNKCANKVLVRMALGA
ncbi:MAG: ATP-binding protein [Eubacteriales bacterium]|nr:ATP-binding protein [Eubacteriales bacterium]